MNHHTKPLLLIFPFGLLSHYLRCLVIAKYLTPYFTIKFAAHPAFSYFVERDGFKVFECNSINENEAIKQLEDFDFSWLNEENLEKCFLDQVRAINQYKPLAVLGDAIPTLKMAAQYTQTHYISLVNGYMTKYYTGTRTLPKKHGIQKLLSLLPESLKQYFTIQGEAIAFKKIHKPFNSLRSKYHLTHLNTYLDEIEGDQTIICDLAELFPQNLLPTTYTCPGPLIYNNGTEKPDYSLDLKRKTIYVTMGSSGSWANVSFLNSSYFNGYNIICSGDKKRVLHAPHISHHHFIEPRDILPFADLIICHGGNGTIYQALANKIPIICIPYHFEQEWNTDVLVKAGLAAALLPGETGTYEALKVIEKLINTKSSGLREKMAGLIELSVKGQPEIIRQAFIALLQSKTLNPENVY